MNELIKYGVLAIGVWVVWNILKKPAIGPGDKIELEIGKATFHEPLSGQQEGYRLY